MLQPRITSVRALPDLTLLISFETGEIKTFDVSPYATGSWYEQLLDNSYFQSVRVLPGGAGIEWPDGQDIAPHELYDLSTTISSPV